MPLLNAGIDEIMFLNEAEFKEILEKWKKYNTEMSELLTDSNYQEELVSYKSINFLLEILINIRCTSSITL